MLPLSMPLFRPCDTSCLAGCECVVLQESSEAPQVRSQAPQVRSEAQQVRSEAPQESSKAPQVRSQAQQVRSSPSVGFQCKECLQSFTKKWNLERHLTRKHGLNRSTVCCPRCRQV